MGVPVGVSGMTRVSSWASSTAAEPCVSESLPSLSTIRSLVDSLSSITALNGFAREETFMILSASLFTAATEKMAAVETTAAASACAAAGKTMKPTRPSPGGRTLGKRDAIGEEGA